MNHTKLTTSLLLLAIAGAVSFYTFQRHVAHKKNHFLIEHPAQRDLTQFVTASGNLKAKDPISVGSLVAGKTIKILAEDNDAVKKDQLLAVLDNGIGDSSIKRLKALLADATARLIYTEKFYARQKALYNSGQLSKNLYEQYTQDYDVAKARVDQTTAELEIETKTYENLFIRSPVDGIVIAKKINLGQMITSQLDATVLFEIAQNLDCLEAHLDVDEADVGMVKECQEAFFTVDSFPKEKFCAKVKRLQYQAKIIDNVVTYATVLDVNNPDLRLRPGMTSNVDIKVAEVKQGWSISNRAFRVSTLELENTAKKLGLTIKKLPVEPRVTSPKQLKTKDYLWILEDDKTIKQIEVTLGINDGKHMQIINGINAQTHVIIDITAPTQDNILLKGVFGKPGGIGSK
ncbi:MAG: efflux RND transporter periplasmic adaptor subunit [Candidatus Babeliales bacterium]|jgi:HlyD family secretion protein